jgi:biopolymer transport protein ExbD
MAFGGFNESNHQAPMAEINVTPMVDVMLVLLVIFIITAPLFTHAIKVDLPKINSAPAPEKPETITLTISADGKLYWNNSAIPINELGMRFSNVSQKKPQPELHLRAEKSTRYEFFAQVLASARDNGMTKIGFVTDPKEIEK